MKKSDNYLVIMAGGKGTRFWPFSRSDYPKQFHDILGTGQSLIQETVDRFRDICPEENVYVVTNEQYKSIVYEQLPFLSDHQVLSEPVGRNTAPCIAYACYKIGSRNPDANVVVAPADHVIIKEKKFEEAINESLEFASKHNALITLGINPTKPETGYGYIQYFEESNEAIRRVKTFTEKPHEELAQKFIESGDFVWNSGIFIWNVKSILESFQTHQPDIAELFAGENSVWYTDKEKDFIEDVYSQCKNISIDYAIMEQADNVYVRLSDFGWTDLGTWKSLYDVKEKDEQGNVIDGNVLSYNTKNCVIQTSKDKLLVVEGLNNYIVAEYDNAMMICRKEHEQKVKDFVADIKSEKGNQYI